MKVQTDNDFFSSKMLSQVIGAYKITTTCDVGWSFGCLEKDFDFSSFEPVHKSTNVGTIIRNENFFPDFEVYNMIENILFSDQFHQRDGCL